MCVNVIINMLLPLSPVVDESHPNPIAPCKNSQNAAAPNACRKPEVLSPAAVAGVGYHMQMPAMPCQFQSPYRRLVLMVDVKVEMS